MPAENTDPFRYVIASHSGDGWRDRRNPCYLKFEDTLLFGGRWESRKYETREMATAAAEKAAERCGIPLTVQRLRLPRWCVVNVALCLSGDVVVTGRDMAVRLPWVSLDTLREVCSAAWNPEWGTVSSWNRSTFQIKAGYAQWIVDDVDDSLTESQAKEMAERIGAHAN